MNFLTTARLDLANFIAPRSEFLATTRTALANLIVSKESKTTFVLESRSEVPAGYTQATWLATLAQFQNLGGLGISVTPLRVLGVATVFACIRVVADSFSSLPITIVKRDGASIRPAPEHPLSDLLRVDPNPEMTGRDLNFATVANCALRGNGYVQILRNAFGTPVELWPIHAGAIYPGRNSRGQLIYRVGARELPAADVVHIKGLTLDGIMGADLPSTLREVFAMAIALQDHGVQFFANGASLGGILEFPTEPSPETKDEIRKQWNEKHVGPKNAHKILITGSGAKFHQPKASQADAQFEQSRKAQDLQICQAFGIPPYKIGLAEGGPKSSAEQAGIEFVTATMLPLVVSWEQAVTKRCLTRQERLAGYEVSVDLEGLMRGDMAAQATYFKTLREIGVFNADEIRARINLSPRADGGGQDYLTPLNMASSSELAAIKKARATATDEPAA